MPGLFRRSSLVRPESDSRKRSSSLPPEEGRGREPARSSRGRSSNPIGLSRHSSLIKDSGGDGDAGSVGGGAGGVRRREPSVERGGGRSQSLTRVGSFSDIRGGSTGIKRTDSFSSVNSYNSDIQEPGWFMHAFCTSSTCTCGVNHEGACDAVNKDDADNGADGAKNDAGEGDSNSKNEADDKSWGDSKAGEDEVDKPSNRVDTDPSDPKSNNIIANEASETKMMDGRDEGGNVTEATEATGVESGLESLTSASCNDSADTNNVSGSGKSANCREGRAGETPPEAPSGNNSLRSSIRSADGNTTVTSFTAADQSIQSEIVGDDDSKLGPLRGYRPKPKHPEQPHDNDVSSLTMETMHSIPAKEKTPKKSKSFVNNVKKNTIGKIKKKSRSFHQNAANGENGFDRSETSIDSSSTASTKESTGSDGRRRRGRSLGLKMRRHGEKTGNGNDGGNPHPYSKRRSRSQTTDREDKDVAKDKRVRERSRSIVRDAMSFMEEIESTVARTTEKQSSERHHGRGNSFSESVQTEESMMDSNESTVASGNVTSKSNSVTPSPARGNGVFLRNKHKDEQALQELQQIHRRRSSGGSENDPLGESEKTMRLLSSLQETNLQNESTILNLQEQLTNLTAERNAFRNNSERMMDIMTKQKSQLEKELRSERKGFADASHAHKKEIEEWKSKASKMEKRCKKAEDDVKEREAQRVKDEGAMRLMQVRMRKDSREGGAGVSSDGQDGPLEKEASLLASTLGIDLSSPLPSNASEAEQEAHLHVHIALLKLSELEHKYNAQLQQLQADNESMKGQAEEWKGKHDGIEKRHQDLLDEREEETAVVNALESKLEGCRVVIESMKKNEESVAVNDELVEKIGDLADENGNLIVKCQQLEQDLHAAQSLNEASDEGLKKELEICQMKNAEATAKIETLTVENRNLRMSFANQDKKSQQMKNLVRNLRSSLNSDDGSPNPTASEGEREDIMEMGHEEALAMIEDVQEENDALHASMEDAIKLAIGMNDKMSNFITAHEDSVKEYEAQVTSLKEELDGARLSKEELSTKLNALKKENRKLSKELEGANSLVVSSISDEIKQEQLSKEGWKLEKRELSSTMDSLKQENERLHESMKEMNSLVATAEECVSKLSEENTSLKDAQEYYEQQLQEMNVEKEANAYLREEIKSVSTEREEAYDTCKVLQQEINMLRKSVKESKGRVERLQSDGSMSEDHQEQLFELTKANDSLTKELEQKNEALQAVQSALESLKDEQSTIKQTIVELRVENARLRDSAAQAQPQPPPSRKSILRQSKLPGDGSDSSHILKLESRIKKVEKENKGLREANSTLSAKLFDEMEKTDALRVANEGLAARICKLVAFIQQNPGSGGAGGGAGSSSASVGGNSKRSKSPAPPKKRR